MAEPKMAERKMAEHKDIVIGAGVLGRAIARMLRAQGREVTLVNRSGGSIDGHPALACDVSDPQQLARVLGASSRIYLCAAPAYARWKQEFPALIDGVCRAVQGRQADIVYGDNLYAYGAQSAPLVESMPYAAQTLKGKVRAAAAERLMALHGHDGVRTCIVRAADFFGPGVEASSVGARVIRDVLAGKPAYLLGNPELPHSLTYLPDQARCMLALAAQPDAYGQAWHTPNNPAQPLRTFLEQLAALAGSSLQVRTAGRFMLRAMGVFKPDMRELVEMLYQFEQPFVVNHDKVTQRFGLMPTRMPQALRETVAWARSQP
jgi:nucleoside-diphosphate-sugar epimerase